jgi:hypothetical protein
MMSCNSRQVINAADKYHIYCLLSVQETLVSVLVHFVIFLFLEGFLFRKKPFEASLWTFKKESFWNPFIM